MRSRSAANPATDVRRNFALRDLKIRIYIPLHFIRGGCRGLDARWFG